jgi:hypothetical protein
MGHAFPVNKNVPSWEKYERLILEKEKHEITGSIKETDASISKIETILSQEKSILNNLLVGL